MTATEEEEVVLWRQRGLSASGERFDGEVLGLYEVRDGKFARAPSLRDAMVLTHSSCATVREAVLHTPPARGFCRVSAPFEEGRQLVEDLGH